VVSAPAQERFRETAEDRPAAGLLAREPPEIVIEEQSRVVA
jgi:hypothetical protein